jgi:hypothetical protein
MTQRRSIAHSRLSLKLIKGSGIFTQWHRRTNHSKDSRPFCRSKAITSRGSFCDLNCLFNHPNISCGLVRQLVGRKSGNTVSTPGFDRRFHLSPFLSLVTHVPPFLLVINSRTFCRTSSNWCDDMPPFNSFGTSATASIYSPGMTSPNE